MPLSFTFNMTHFANYTNTYHKLFSSAYFQNITEKSTTTEVKGDRKRGHEDVTSFFLWFTDLDPTSDEPAELIKDDIWPNPLQFYLVCTLFLSLPRQSKSTLLANLSQSVFYDIVCVCVVGLMMLIVFLLSLCVKVVYVVCHCVIVC